LLIVYVVVKRNSDYAASKHSARYIL